MSEEKPPRRILIMDPTPKDRENWSKEQLIGELRESDFHILDQDTPLRKITREIKRSGGEITFRDLKKSHCFSDSKIRGIVGENLDKLEIFIWQNPAGGPRSERVRIKHT